MAAAICYGSSGGGASVCFHIQAGNYDTATLIEVINQLSNGSVRPGICHTRFCATPACPSHDPSPVKARDAVALACLSCLRRQPGWTGTRWSLAARTKCCDALAW
jgi:hypothetical protein